MAWGVASTPCLHYKRFGLSNKQGNKENRHSHLSEDILNYSYVPLYCSFLIVGTIFFRDMVCALLGLRIFSSTPLLMKSRDLFPGGLFPFQPHLSYSSFACFPSSRQIVPNCTTHCSPNTTNCRISHFLNLL